MRRVLLILAAVAAMGMTGCAVQVSSQYTPSILMEGNGDVTVSDFIYKHEGLNAKQKENFQNNEIYTFSGFNPVYLDKPVAEFVADAVRKELKFMGYKLQQSSGKVISGTIKEASVDYIGFISVDYKFKILFVIKNPDGAVVFSKDFTGEYSESKFTSFSMTSGLYTALAKSIENFVKAAQKDGFL